MTPYANLHLHSTHSDGVYTPTELVAIAKQEGYRALALTDHDTVTGCPEMKVACEKEGLEFLFGAEFSVPKYHIVGFGFDPTYPQMKQYLADMALRQTDNTRQCFDLAASKGDINGITWDEVLDFNPDVAWLCNNHVFRAMKAKGLIVESEYMHWFDQNFRKQRKLFPPLYDFLPPDRLIKLIHDAGGIAILAHPNGKLGDIPGLVEYGLDGIEVWHPDLPEDERTRAHDVAREYGLMISGGTDHSGLCGGYYSSYPTEEELKQSSHYIPPLHFGTTHHYFNELAQARLMRD